MGLSPELIRRLHSPGQVEFGRGATPQEIQLAEQQLSVVFPRSYKEFLEQFGWASLEGLELYGLGEDVPAYLDLVKVTLSERMEMRPRLPRPLLPLMNDGAGNHYCLDVGSGEQGECPVVFWDHNQGESQDPEYVARNLEAWLSEELNTP
ncbi:MAG: SMI1/KNR4 family protein [Chloroflexota bacterium]|nr:SMI1/KNR4 family protein [Chloroflexota bacterium]